MTGVTDESLASANFRIGTIITGNLLVERKGEALPPVTMRGFGRAGDPTA